jgi:glycosyltransferase involved in cell wall biosynthesis
MSTETCFTAPGWSVRIPRFPERRLYVPRVRPFARELDREGVDLVHVVTPGPLGLVGRRLARRFGVPVVGSCHAHFGERVEAVGGLPWLGRRVDNYVRWFYASSRMLLVPSNAARQRLVVQGDRPDRIRVWSGGVDPDRFSPSRASAKYRHRWQVDDRRLAIFYAGRLAVEEGLRLLAPLQRELYRRGVEHRFVIAGEGPMLDELRRECPESVFLGRAHQGQVAVAMASADLLLCPSASDACDHLVLEAQASGLPVIVSDAGPARHQMIPDATGAVCRAGDVAAFVDAIVRMRHPIVRRSMSVAARQHALTREWPETLRPLFDAWRDALGQPAREVQPAVSTGGPALPGRSRRVVAIR